jgi:hypothetical protein
MIASELSSGSYRIASAFVHEARHLRAIATIGIQMDR